MRQGQRNKIWQEQAWKRSRADKGREAEEGRGTGIVAGAGRGSQDKPDRDVGAGREAGMQGVGRHKQEAKQAGRGTH
jgi:hypothetical protein